MDHLDPDVIALLALGERDDTPQTHLRACPACRDELTQMTRTVELARNGGDLGLQTPVLLPPGIWTGIAEDLGIGVPRPRVSGTNELGTGRLGASAPTGAGGRGAAGSSSGPGTPDLPRTSNWAESTGAPEPARPAIGPHRRRPFVRRGLLVAATVIAVAGGVLGGVAIGQSDSVAAPAVQSQAALAPMPSAPASAHGSASVTLGAAGLSLHVSAEALPLRQGYYEVWLYDATADQMIAVGTLGTGGDGVWTLASTIDLRSYNVVDVSAQDFDGNPAHKDSVLRGTLTQ